MTTKKILKKIVHFDINNRTSVKVESSIYSLYENQDFYKNGKPKGKTYNSYDYYFFDNDESYCSFMKKHLLTPKAASYITLDVEDSLRYDSSFLLSRMNLEG